MKEEKFYEVLKRFAHSKGIALNKDSDLVLELIRGLIKNEERYGYRSCPCRLASGDIEKDKDIICPCVYSEEDIREYGRCYCGLYVTDDFNKRNMTKTIVPERRKKQ